MSWFPFGPNCDCSGVPATITPCPFPTPPILSNPRAVLGIDYRNQPGQIAAPQVASFLVAAIDGNGNPVIMFSPSPNILPASYPLQLGQKFTGLVSMMGSSGGMRLLTPTGLSGIAYLTANPDGTWNLSASPASSVPDPLTIGTINATNLNSQSLSISGLPTFTGLTAGTVTQQIGLNASNQLVVGTTSTTGVAQYYESTSLVSVATPNATVTAGVGLVIGNEIFDPNGLAHVQDAQTIVIDQAGTFLVRWGGTWGRGLTTAYHPAIFLAYNSIGNIVSNGYSNAGAQGAPAAGNIAWGSNGEWAQTLAVNDKLFLLPGGTWNTSAGNSNLSNVGLMLQRVQ